ncbi:hypothetical protein RCL1_004245 [Eukaryota sp. TZLM3-RCL]
MRDKFENLIVTLGLPSVSPDLIVSYTCVHFSDDELESMALCCPYLQEAHLLSLSKYLDKLSEDDLLTCFNNLGIDPLSLVIFLSFLTIKQDDLSLLSVLCYYKLLHLTFPSTRFSHVLYLKETLNLLSFCFSSTLSDPFLSILTNILELVPNIISLFNQTEFLLKSAILLLTGIFSFPFNLNSKLFTLESPFQLNITASVPSFLAFSSLIKLIEIFNSNFDEDFLSPDQSQITDEAKFNFYHVLLGSFAPIVLLNPTELSKNCPKNSLMSYLTSLSQSIYQLFAFIFNEYSKPSFLSLIRTLLLKCPGRAQSRSTVCEFLTSIFQFLRASEDVFSIVEYLLLLSKSSTTSCRLISIDALSSTVQLFLTDNDSFDINPTEILSLILPVIVERLSDVSPFVRIRSITFFTFIFNLISKSNFIPPFDSINSFIEFISQEVVNTILLRLHDPKPLVRKSCVSILPFLYQFDCALSSLRSLLFDVSPVVRKQALLELHSSLVGLNPEINYPQLIPSLCDLLIDTAVSLSNDSETSVRTCLINLIIDVVINPLINQSLNPVTCQILAKISYKHFMFFKNLFETMSCREKIVLNIKNLMSIFKEVDEELIPGIFVIGSALSCYYPVSFSAELLTITFRKWPSICSLVLDQSKKSLATITSSSRSKLVDLFKSGLSLTFDSATLHCVVKGLMYFSDKSLQTWLNNQTQEFINQLISTTTMAQNQSNLQSNPQLLENFQSLLFLIGELVLCCSIKMSLLTALMSSLHVIITPSFNSPFSSFVPFAITTLGKLMSISEAIAKQSITLVSALLASGMGNFISHPTPPAVRVNILTVLSFLCQRFPSIVDSRLPLISLCLADSSVTVAKSALSLLCSGLKEDFIKLKPNLLFRLLFACTVPHLSGVARAVLSSTIASRPHRKSFLAAHFVESIFVFTNCRHHKSFNQFNQTPEEQSAFNLTGQECVERRRYAYSTVLRLLTDQDKFNMANKCVELLGQFADGELPILDCYDVVSDCFAIICCQEVRFASINSQENSKDEEEAEHSEKLEQAGQRMVTSLLRQNLAELIVPTFAALKFKLASLNSPLLGELFKCLNILLDEFKSDLEKVLTADPEFAQQVMFERKLSRRSGDEGDSTVTPLRPYLATPRANAVTPAGLASAVEQVGAVSVARRTTERLSLSHRSARVPIATPVKDHTGRPIPLQSPLLVPSSRDVSLVSLEEPVEDFNQDEDVQSAVVKTKRKSQRVKTRSRTRGK